MTAIVAIISVYLLTPTSATPPSTMNFQGRLMDSSGSILANGQYNMQFRIYSAPTGGTALWSETREASSRVQVTNGLFSTQLGQVNPLPASLFTASDLYFEITMPTPATATCNTASCASWESPMTPRNKLATSAYAFNASMLDGMTAADFAAASGSNNYIQNTTSPQTADFNITGTGTAATLQANTLDRASAGTLTVGGANATAITLADNTTVNGSLETLGTATFRNASDSDSAFQIQNADSDVLLNADTADMKLSIGSATGSDARLYVSGEVQGDNFTWTARTAAEANQWQSVTYGNGLFVAVASSGTNRVMTSPDGITWTPRTAAEANSWNSVTYGNGLFVAVSSNGTNRVMTSPDGITWTARTAAEANQWQSVTYGGGLFVTVANWGTNRVMTSPDGITWTARTAAEANSWYSVTYGNGLFVAVANSGTNQVMTSPDGITWTARTAAEANYWSSVTYGNGQFVAVANWGTNRVMTSPDGITWTARTAAEVSDWSSVTYGNGQFVAVANWGTNRVMTSPDGITWTALTAAQANGWSSVTYGNGLFVAVAYTGTNRVMTSSGYGSTALEVDGRTALNGLTEVNGELQVAGSTSLSSTTISGNTQLNGASNTIQTTSDTAFTIQDSLGDTLLAANTNTNTLGIGAPASSNVRLSITGDLTWTARSTPNSYWTSVTYGNGLFVAVANSGTNRVMTSPDGITWTARTAAQANDWISVTYGNGLFVAVANNGTNRVMTSPDGITWTARTAAEANSWNSVTYGNGLFVAVAGSGTNQVMTSPDGITWTARTAAEANIWYSVTYGNGLFVAVAYNGTNRVMTSPDGITWTARTAPNANWYSVTYGNGLFVAVANSGTNRVMTSPDGITWTARTAAQANQWSSVTYGNGLFVAVAGVGTNKVMTSPDGIAWTARTAAENAEWQSVTYGNGLFVAVAYTGINRVMTIDMNETSRAVHVYGSTTLQGTTRIKTDSSTAFQVQNAAGVGLLTVDTANSRVIIGTTANGITMSANGIVLAGTARASNKVTLAPEYPNALFVGDGSSNDGTLTSGFCSGSSRQNINSSACGSTQTHSYYEWTTTEATAQDYEFVVRYQMPSNYSTGSMTNLSIWGWGSATSNQSVTVALYSDASGTACSTSSNAITAANTWNQTVVSSPLGSCTPAAGDMVTLRVRVQAIDSGAVRAGAITFNYMATR